jgi:hypothetical protein
MPDRLVRANSGLMHRDKIDAYSITSLASAALKT